MLHVAPSRFLTSTLVVESWAGRLGTSTLWECNLWPGYKKRMKQNSSTRKATFHCNPTLRLIMHILQATIFSIASLAFTASASPSPVGISGPLPCTLECSMRCYVPSDCEAGAYCVCSSPSVSSVLLLAGSKLVIIAATLQRFGCCVVYWRKSALSAMKISRVRTSGKLQALLSQIRAEMV